jgi:molybdopterin biosynthesis enzyme
VFSFLSVYIGRYMYKLNTSLPTLPQAHVILICTQDPRLLCEEQSWHIHCHHQAGSYNVQPSLAGKDIQRGRSIVKTGQIIKSSHLLPTASVGLHYLAVQPKPQVYVWSTGIDLGSGKMCISYVNELFLSATRCKRGRDAAFLRSIEDEAKQSQEQFRR